MRARQASSIGRISSWVYLTFALVVYAGIVTALYAADLGANTVVLELMPLWTAVLAPPMIYALLILMSLSPFSLVPYAGATLVCCAVHALLVLLTGGLISAVAPMPYRAGLSVALWQFPLATVLQIVSVPLILVPFRDLLRPLARARASDSAPARRSSPTVPPMSATAAPSLGEAAAVAPMSMIPPAASPPGPPVALVTGERDEALLGATRVASSDSGQSAPIQTAKRQAERVDVPTIASVSSPSPARVVRIPFDRIAGQLPAEAFSLPFDRLAASLQEPGHLLIPSHVLLPQLAEGHAEIAWDMVADQFPPAAVSASTEEIKNRLTNGALVLPLDEVIRQLPSELFAVSSPALDIGGIEEFPLPFQPEIPAPAPPSEEPVKVEAQEPAATSAHEALTDIEPPAADVPGRALEFEAARTPASGEPSPVEIRPAEMLPVDVPPLKAWQADAPAEDKPVSEEPVAAALPDIDLRPLIAHLKPVMSALEIDTRRERDITLVMAVSPALPKDEVGRTAARILPFLTDRRIPAPATQVTLRCSGGAIVVTPLGDPRRQILVTGVPRNRSLALIELASMRAAADGNARIEAAAPERSAARPAAVETGLHPDGAVSPLAATELLEAFGPLKPSVFRDDDGGLRLHVFLPQEAESFSIGHFVCDVHRALLAIPARELGPFQSIVFRLGANRVVIRNVETGAGRAAILVAGGGPVDRPGLAHRDVERALARLGSS